MKRKAKRKRAEQENEVRKYFLLTVRPGGHGWHIDEYDGRGAWVGTSGRIFNKGWAQREKYNLRRRLMRQGLKPWKGEK